MHKKSLLLLLLPLILCGCPSNENVTPDVKPSEDLSGDPVEPIDQVDPIDPVDPEDDPEEESRIDHISLSEHELILEVNKQKDLTVNFFPSDPNDNLDDCKDGEWSSSDESVATVRYGRVNTLKVGKTLISYTTIEGKKKATCVVTVIEDASKIKKEYIRVDDVNDIKDWDQIIFGCPQANKVSSLNRLDQAMIPVDATFSSDGSKLTSYSDNTAIYLVTEGEDFFTLENQEGQYLAGKWNVSGGNILHVNKGPIRWMFEHVSEEEQPGFGGNYVYSLDIESDQWLMFNIKDSVNKFTLYNSNENYHMFRPTVYRLTLSI